MEMNFSDKDVKILNLLFGRGLGRSGRTMREQMAFLIDGGALRLRDGEACVHLQGVETGVLARTLAEAVIRASGAQPDKLCRERFVESLVKMGFERRITDRQIDLLFREFGVDGKWLGAGEIAQMVRSGWLVFDGRGFAYAG